MCETDEEYWLEKANNLSWDCRNKYSNKKAIEYLNKCLEINPKNLEALDSKIERLQNLELYESELNCINKAIKLDRENLEWWEKKILVLQFLDRHRDAVLACDNALKYASVDESIEILKGKIGILIEWGKYDRALECYDRLCSFSNKESIKILDEIAMMASYDEREKEENYWIALECYDRIIKIEPKNIDAWFGKVKIYEHHIEDFEEAISCLKKILDIEPNNEKVFDRVFERLEICYEKNGEYETALGTSKTYLSLIKDSKNMHPDSISFHQRKIEKLRERIKDL